MDLIHKAVHELFTNRFEQSEKTLQEGMERSPSQIQGDHDLRGAFALIYALVSVMRGIATFADDQLIECESRLKRADELACKDDAWVGRKVVRGICTIQIGVIQILQQSYVKGFFNVIKSWGWIKSLESEGLTYVGKETEVVRSAALFTLGIFYLLLGLLPPTSMKVASWLSGFPGDRAEGIRMIRTCWEEGGVLAPWAALSLLAYHVDTKTFLGEPLNEDEILLTTNVLKFADEHYPGSLFFAGLKSDFYAVTQRDIPLARKLNEEEGPKLSAYPALTWVWNYKRGMYAVTDLDWYEAGKFFRTSSLVYIEVGRRSMVPAMSAFSLICFAQSAIEGKDVEDSKLQFEEMLERLEEYRSMKKKNWQRQDAWGFEILERYRPNAAEKKKKKKKKKKYITSAWPLLDLVKLMVLQIRCSWWMKHESLDNLLEKLRKAEDKRKNEGKLTPDERVQVEMCCMEILSQKKDTVGVMKAYQDGIGLKDDLSKEGKELGAIPVMHYLAAQFHHLSGDLGAAKFYLNKVKQCGTNYKFHALLMLKIVVLERSLGIEIEHDFEKVEIPSGKTKSLVIDIPREIEVPFVNWFWLVKKHTVNFEAKFFPANGDAEIELQSIEHRQANEDDDMTAGELSTEGLGAGRLILKWDNTFSILRSKSVKYRISPPGLEMHIN